jgi:hypothetical protein
MIEDGCRDRRSVVVRAYQRRFRITTSGQIGTFTEEISIRRSSPSRATAIHVLRLGLPEKMEFIGHVREFLFHAHLVRLALRTPFIAAQLLPALLVT